jgi:hypothetical protein
MKKHISIEREITFLNIEGYKLVGSLSDTFVERRADSRFPYIFVVNLVGLHTKPGNKIKSVFQYESDKGIHWYSGKQTVGLTDAERLCFEVVPHGYTSLMSQNLVLKNPFWQEFIDEVKNLISTIEVINS